MNLLQLRTAARERLDDTVQPYGWSDDELNGFINEAVNEAALRARLLIDSTTADCCTVDVTLGTATYALNAAVFEVKRVVITDNNRKLCRVGYEDLDRNRLDWEDDTGMPEYYFLDNEQLGVTSLVLYPVPDADLTLNLTVFRLPLAAMAQDEDTNEIPERHQSDLLHWACHLAYLKQDADTLNSSKADYYEQKFTQAFGLKQNAELVDWRRKHRKIHVQGQYF
jgi:hypothetical protein